MLFVWPRPVTTNLEGELERHEEGMLHRLEDHALGFRVRDLVFLVSRKSNTAGHPVRGGRCGTRGEHHAQRARRNMQVIWVSRANTVSGQKIKVKMGAHEAFSPVPCPSLGWGRTDRQSRPHQRRLLAFTCVKLLALGAYALVFFAPASSDDDCDPLKISGPPPVQRAWKPP